MRAPRRTITNARVGRVAPGFFEQWRPSSTPGGRAELRGRKPMSMMRRLVPVVGAMAMLATIFTPVPASAAPNDPPVTGSLFVDFDRNGELDTTDGVANTDPLFPPAGITVTAYDIDGNSVVGVVTPGSPPTYSIDPTTLTGSDFRVEFTLDPADVTTGWSPTVRGADSASNVQFVSAGDVANYGVVPPSKCPEGADGDGSIFFTCHTVVPGLDTVVTTDYNTANPVTNAVESDTGSVWGVAYDEWTNTIWTSAVHRRGFALGGGGLAALYAQTDGGAWVTHDLGAGFGSVAGLNELELATAVGRVGIGDIDLHDDGRTMFVTNLATNAVHVYDVSTGTPVQTTVIPVPDPGCTAGDSYRIWAVKATSATTALVGATCTADVSQDAANLSASVIEVSTAGTTSPVPGLTGLPLDFTRGCAVGDATCTPTSQPWTEDADYLESQAITKFGANWNDVMQPLLSDIEIGPTGDIVLAFLDRTAYQHSGGSLWDNTTGGLGTYQLTTATGGDLLHVDNTGTVDSPTYVVEPQVTANDGSEFFSFETIGTFHQETASGSVWVHPVKNEVIATVIDPITVDSYGFEVGDVETGASVAGYTLGGTTERVFKSGVLGDVEGCFAPIEVGDRVWLDLDMDGIQDPGEVPLEGVTVTITGPGLPAEGVTVQTDAEGIWTFDSNDGLLASETYSVAIDQSTNTTALPAGFTNADLTPTTQDATAAPANDDNDSDVTAAGTIAVTTGAPGTNDHSFDAGFSVPIVQIGNYVWDDLNADGIQDANEPVVPDVVVNLLDENGDPVLDAGGAPVTTTTDAAGEYYFQVPAGMYIVEFDESTLPANRIFTAQDSGGDDAVDSDADPVTGRTPVIDVSDPTALTDTDGDGIPDDYSWDAGIVSPVRIGNVVWDDLNADGIQDANEPVVPDVVVNLLDENGDPVLDADGAPRTTMTDANGEYFFDVADDMYIVEFEETTLPANRMFTSVDSGGDDAVDSDADPATGRTAVITVDRTTLTDTDGDGLVDDYSWDAGIVTPVRIGNFVWDDLNADGIQDANEPVVPDVVVNLLDENGDPVLDANGAPVTTMTDAAGEYYFDVAPGMYIVEFDETTLPEGKVFTTLDSGGDDAVDSDADPTTGQTAVIDVSDPSTLTDTDADGIPDDYSWDAGIISVRIGNYVWVDGNADGIQDQGEDPVPDVVVNLLDENGDPVLDANGAPRTTMTDAAGEYFFDVPPGMYSVEFDPASLPEGTVFTTQDSGGDDTLDSDADPVTGRTAVIDVSDPTTLTDSDGDGILDDNTWDAGIIKGRLGNYVWDDLNADGIQDANEPAVPDVVVNLLDENGDPVLDANGAPRTTMTDAAGEYYFDVPPGMYIVEFDETTLPDNRIFTTQDAGGDDAVDSDADPTTGQTAVIDMSDFSALTDTDGDGIVDDYTWDAGIVTPVRIGNFVWVDANADGVQDANEPAVPDVVVNLLDENGDPVLDANGAPRTTMTDAAGEYYFDVAPGMYIVEFDPTTIPENTGFTAQDVGGDDAVDSDADPTTGRTAVIDVSDPSLLTDTDADGLPDDYSWDAGVVQVRIGNFVWDDLNADGIQDANEPAVPDVVVNLLDENGDPVLDANGAPVTTMTDAAGEYYFDVAPGMYIVEFDESTLPENKVFTSLDSGGDDAVDSDADPTTGRTAVIDVTDLTTLTDTDADGIVDDYSWDAGIVSARLGNFVWDDLNADGIQDANEPAVPDVVVNLLDENGDPVLDANGAPRTTMTDANGEYFFDVVPGMYIVEFDESTLPANRTFTTQGNGDDATGSDADPATGRTGVIDMTDFSTLEDSDGDGIADDYTWDAGIVSPVRIGNFVWMDANADGLQDPGEMPVPDIVVSLLDANGDPVLDENGAPVTTVTDAAGEYYFEVAPGEYIVEFDPESIPEGVVFTSQDSGDDALDSDADTTTGRTAVIDVTDPSAHPDTDGDGIPDDYTWDAGLVAVRIGNYVWDDLNGDGLQDAAELAVPGVVVNLLDENGDPVLDSAGEPRTTTTDVNGEYYFDVEPGTYIVEFDPATLPEGKGFTTPLSGDPALDSDADPTTGRTGVIDVSDPSLLTDTDGDGKVDDYSWDAGIVSVQLGNYVWDDLNGDGLQDAAEPAVPGVVVNLLDENGDPVLDSAGEPRTATTDANGEYIFDVPPGKYIVEFDPATLPEGKGFTTPLSGDPALDSDADPTTGRTGIIDVSDPTTLGDENGDGLVDDLTWDAGIVSVRIGTKVFDDADGDGQQGPGEAPVPGVVVNLLDENGDPVLDSAGEPITTTTDANGEYFFDAPPGKYIVEFDPTTLPEGKGFTTPNVGDDATDSDADPATGRTGVIDTTDPASLGDSDGDGIVDAGPVDAGITSVRIGNKVFDDTNGDGLQDPGEAPVPGVVVNLLDENGDPVLDAAGEPITTTTDAAGEYMFDVPPGKYIVEFDPDTLPEGKGFTSPNTGDPELDSDADPMTGRSGVIDVTDVSALSDTDGDGVVDDLTWDAGITSVRLGNKVWFDANNDGLQDVDEDPVPDVVVNLLDANGQPVLDGAGEPITTTTDADGEYYFDVAPGMYIVEFDPDTLPDEHLFTARDAGGVGSDSDADRVSGRTAIIDLTDPASLMDTDGDGIADDYTWDAGIIEDFGDIRPLPEEVSGAFFLDTNNDGLITDGEEPIEGVKLRLLDDGGTVVAEFETDANGYWKVEQLRPGVYELVIDPSNFEPGGALFGLISPDDVPADGYRIVAGAAPGTSAFGNEVDVLIRRSLPVPSVPAVAPPVLALTGGERPVQHGLLSLLLVSLGSLSMALGRRRRRI